jgi:hypothetical protein
LDIGLKASKEILDTLKYVRERILASRNAFGCLIERDFGVVEAMESRGILTERRTPIPVKITPAGGYTYTSMNIRP